jgi:acetyltransferase
MTGTTPAQPSAMPAAMDDLAPRRVTDRTGAPLLLRPIRAEDWRALQKGFESWSDAQKRNRMLNALSNLTDAMARRYATPHDPEHEICLVLTPEDRPDDLLGGARIIGHPEREDGEFAVSVRADAQGRGLGRLALSGVLEVARAHGHTRIWGLISRRNAPMLALARGLGFAVRPFPDDWTLMLAEKTLRRAFSAPSASPHPRPPCGRCRIGMDAARRRP